MTDARSVGVARKLKWQTCGVLRKIIDSACINKQPKITLSESQMPNITFIDFEGTKRTVEGKVGDTVMETATGSDLPGIDADCGGACACATCHVYVDVAWTEIVGKPDELEAEMLDVAEEVRDNSRLSCQIKISEDMDGLVVSTPESQY